jgi:hypothetical protein
MRHQNAWKNRAEAACLGTEYISNRTGILLHAMARIPC